MCDNCFSSAAAYDRNQERHAAESRPPRTVADPPTILAPRQERRYNVQTGRVDHMKEVYDNGGYTWIPV